MYVHGSEAVAISDFRIHKNDYDRAEKQRAEKRKRARAKIALRKKRAKALLAAFTVFAAAAVMLLRYGQIAALCQEVSLQKDELSAMSARVTEKEMEMERSLDLRVIEREAQTRLGMVRPQKNQIIYVSLGSPDTSEVLHSPREEGSVLGFINKIGAFLEYLY